MTLATPLRAAAEISVALAGAPGLRWLIALGGLGQLAGTALFVLNMWRRVRMPPRPSRTPADGANYVWAAPRVGMLSRSDSTCEQWATPTRGRNPNPS